MRQQWLAIFIVAVTFVTGASVAHTAEWEVPGDRFQIEAILDSLAAIGDTITVTTADDDTENQTAFTVSYPVLIRNLTGQTITIEASTSWAVNVTTASGATIDGFRIVGGTGTGIARMVNGAFLNCAFEDDGNAYTGGAVVLDGPAELRNCTIDLTSTSSPRAVVASQDDAVIEECTITSDYAGGASGNVTAIYAPEDDIQILANSITFSDSANDAIGIIAVGIGSIIEDNTLSFAPWGMQVAGSASSVRRNVIRLVDATYGIYVASTGSVAIERNTIHSMACGAGAGVFLPSASASATIANNLIVNLDYGIYVNGASTSATINHNVYWGSCSSGSNLSLTSTQMANKEPLFCKSREAPVGFFTQRIDSDAAPGNNGWGEVVGVFDIECAFGNLAYDTTVPSGKSVLVLEDVTVPSGKSLTLNSGVTVRFDEDDNAAGGSNSGKNELIVDGDLTVSGTSGSRVVFQSAKASPAEGDWAGIDARDATSQSIDYADIRHAGYGLSVRQDAASSVTNSLFSENDGIDIFVGSSGSDSTSATITGNTITVHTGIGIEVSGNASGTVIEDNTINGSSTSLVGIRHASLSGSSKPSFIDNVISGFTNGKGIESTVGAPVLKENEATNGKWAFYFSGGNPKLGAAADTTSDNIASGNSTSGGFFTGSSTTGKVRQSRFTGNGTGIITKGNANPDLGTSGDYGNNIFLSNTTYCLWNQSTSGTVSAQGNYKGACTPPTTCWNGSFDLANALCTVPAGGPELPVEAVAGGHGLRSLLRVPHPNPSAGPTVLSFRLAEAEEDVTVAIYDVGGRLVRRFEVRPYDAGEHEVFWDGTADSGRPSPSGLYFVRVRTGGATVGTTRLILAR
jgi:hypothetical protein